jgi:hypothetical protein
LELFERVTGEPFTESPGALVSTRVRAMAKVMGNICREVQLVPPMTAAMHRG